MTSASLQSSLTSSAFQNPPEQDLKASGTSLTERKEKRSKRREQEQSNNPGNEDSGNGSQGEDDFGDDDDAEWSTDVSKEAVKQRMKVSCPFHLKLTRGLAFFSDD